MNKKHQLDLTNGPIMKTLAELALPIMASSFLGTAYNITDMAWIGVLGSKAVAGVGMGGMYVWLSQGLCSLARMGGQVNVAQSCGRNDTRSAIDYAAASIQLTCIFAFLFSAVCLLFTGPLLAFFHLEDAQTFAYAEVYMKITCGLIISSYMNYTLTGLYTAQGDSKTPFAANLIGLVMNMILDPLLILGIGPFPRLEVTGAAIATAAAQLVVMLVMIAGIFLRKNSENILRKIHLFSRTSGSIYRSICRIGVPTALQGTLYCMISMVLTRMVSAFGPGAVATQRVGGQIESISWNTSDGFAAALNSFTAQNYGAGKNDRIRQGYQISLRIMITWGLIVTAAFVLFPKQIASLFFHEEDVLKTAVGYLVILGIGEAFMCVEMLTIGALSGLGKTKICSVISILLTGARIPLALLLTRTALGLTGIWWALTLSSMAKGVVFYFAFHKVSQDIERESASV